MADRAKALFAAVYADPAADGPRSVLADHLQEQGDPRGEFIALQLAKLSRKPIAAATRRERALLAEHQAAWLGTLVGVVNEPNSTWARGFLDTVTAELSDDTPADPSWNTVRTIRIVGGFPPKTKVLGAGCFRALTDVASVALDHVGDVLDAKRKPPQIEALAIYGPRVEPGKAWDRRQLKLVERLVELPRLSRLALRISRNPWTGRDLDWLWATAIARRVTHLQVGMDLPFDLAGCLPGIATLDNLESFAMAHNYFTFRLTRDGDRAWSQLVVEWDGMTNAAGPLSHVARVIRELPPDTLTTFRFDHPTARWSTRALAVVTNAVARQTRIKRKR